MNRSDSGRILFVLSFAFLFSFGAFAQNKSGKDIGLLWEITGNGLTKPSYLYGTMHLTNKVAFNLSDSFFNALQKCGCGSQ